MSDPVKHLITADKETGTISIVTMKEGQAGQLSVQETKLNPVSAGKTAKRPTKIRQSKPSDPSEPKR